jgi:acetolactate synthase I/III small subunit
VKLVISLLVENQFGVLARVAGVFAARALNIDSLNVAETDDPEISFMTIITTGNHGTIDQVLNQLSALMNVVTVAGIKEGGRICREMALVEVNAGEDRQEEFLPSTEDFGGE